MKILFSISIYRAIKFLFFFLFFTNLSLSQNLTSKIEISFKPLDKKYLLLEKNNYGKKVISPDIDYFLKLNRKNIYFQISISNAYQKNGFGETFLKYSLNDSINLKIGKFYRDFSTYLNDELSSGSMLVSNNAEPIPKVSLLTTKKVKKNEDFSFYFGLSHGQFEKNNYFLERPFLHEKFFYFNINKGNDSIGIGLVHEAVWGGKTKRWGEFPDSFKDFFKVIISADGPIDEGAAHANALGSHLAIWDFFYKRENSFKLYYQHFFEDTSGLRFANKNDGLWGIELENVIPKTLLLVEYINTSNMCGNSPYLCDFYYWNYQYGPWVYRDKIIGNAFINSNDFINREYVKIINLGFKTTFESIELKFRALRKINLNDGISYETKILKEINNNNLYVFFVGDDSSSSIGFGFEYYIKK